MESVFCNVCGNSQATLRWTVPDFLLDRPQVQATLVECNACGLIYQNPRPTPEEMAIHYPPEYELYSESPRGNGAALTGRAIAYGVAKRARFVTRHKRGGRLLDVGCATGIFLHSFQGSNWETYGVETSEYAARIARDRYHLRVQVGTLEQAHFADEFFDAVTLWDVLEHLHDPRAGVKEIYRILKPDGVITIRVPNAQSRDAKWFGRYWAGLEPPRHLYVFTPVTLNRLLEQGGFQAEEWTSGGGAYPTFVLSLRFWLRGHPRMERWQDRITRLLYHPVLRLVTAPFFYLSSLRLNGPVMVVTACKKRASQA